MRMLLALLLSAQSAGALPIIIVRPSVTGFVVDAKPYDPSIVRAVDAEIARRAEAQCAGKTISWGKFQSSTQMWKPSHKRAPRVSGDLRTFTCVDPQPRLIVAAPEGWAPTPTDDADVRKLFETYYATRDSGHVADAKRMFSPETISSGSGWEVGARNFTKRLGTGKRQITTVSWEVNPTAADRPGIFAAIDFVGEYPNAQFYCGYIGLYRLGPGKYQIVREEQNSAMRSDGVLDPVQLGQMRAGMCRE